MPHDYTPAFRYADGGLVLYTGHLVVDLALGPTCFAFRPGKDQRVGLFGVTHAEEVTWCPPAQLGRRLHLRRHRCSASTDAPDVPYACGLMSQPKIGDSILNYPDN